MIIGGALGTTFNFAVGGRVGNSLYEPEQKDTALEILDYAEKNNYPIISIDAYDLQVIADEERNDYI